MNNEIKAFAELPCQKKKLDTVLDTILDTTHTAGPGREVPVTLTICRVLSQTKLKNMFDCSLERSYCLEEINPDKTWPNAHYPQSVIPQRPKRPMAPRTKP